MMPIEHTGGSGLVLRQLTLMVALWAGSTATAQPQEAWFGLPSPGPVTDQIIDFDNLDLPRIPAPPVGPAEALDGAGMLGYAEDIVQFSYASRDAGDRLWGRYAGSAFTDQAVGYVAEHLRRAGLVVEERWVAFTRINHPVEWSLRVLGIPEFGPQSNPVELASAIPMGISSGGVGIPGSGANAQPTVVSGPQTVTAPLLFVGDGSATALTNVDISGKIAVFVIDPVPSAFYAVSGRATQTLVNAGALGAIGIYDMPGNMQLFFGGCVASVLCFNVGGEDGAFLRSVIERAAKVGLLDKLQAELRVTREQPRDLRQRVLIARIPGRDSSENIVISTHSDSHFAGANDNASGMAALIALAKYYVAAPQPQHDLYFFLSPGHHHATGGTAGLVEFDPKLPKNNIVLLNLEHIAQAGVYRSYMSLASDKYGRRSFDYVPTNWDSQGREVTLSPMNSVAIKTAWADAARRNGFTAPARYLGPAIAEPAAWTAAGGTAIQDVETSPWFHTSGDVVETLSAEAFQRAALFYRDFIDAMDGLSRAEVLAGAQ